jgi:DNA-directed RNA polymerase sigma subunit (sigma70/sigma32)
MFLNEGLVITIAKKYWRYNTRSKIELIDLIQCGKIGMLRAIDKYEIEKGTLFITCAYLWVRKEI